MKLRKLLLLSTPVILTAGTMTTALTGCSANRLPKVEKCEIKPTPLYIYSRLTSGEYQYIDIGTPIEIALFNGLTIPYMNVEEFVKVATLTTGTHSVEIQNNKAIIKNNINESSATIDYVQQTITFDDYDSYKSTSSNGAFAGIVGGGENYFFSVDKKYTKGNSVTIKLYDYGIKAYFHEGKAYLPYDLFYDVLDIYTNPMLYNGKGVYQIIIGDNPNMNDAYMKIRKEATAFTPEYMEYTYNLLALVLDFRFGMSERESRSNPGQTIKYLNEGAYKMLAPYHDRLVSTESNVSSEAYKEVFTNHLDDGGHARYYTCNLFNTMGFEKNSIYGKETKHTFDTNDKLNEAKADASLTYKDLWKADGYSEAFVNRNGVNSHYAEYTAPGQSPIAYITFDEFKVWNVNNLNLAEVVAGRELADYTDETNYWQDTFRLTMYANKMIKKNNIKDVVIDISTNGGGVISSETFIASWICNGVTQKIYNPHTNAYCEYTIKADINGDGKYTEDDYLGSDVNVYFITSSASFSCGNLLPCNVRDCRPTTYFIGEKSGGGACAVDQNILTGQGNIFRSSSSQHILRTSSSYGNYVSNDSGCPVDYSINPSTNPEKYYDRETINKRIWGI